MYKVENVLASEAQNTIDRYLPADRDFTKGSWYISHYVSLGRDQHGQSHVSILFGWSPPPPTQVVPPPDAEPEPEPKSYVDGPPTGPAPDESDNTAENPEELDHTTTAGG